MCAALALHRPTAAALILAASVSLPLLSERASADAIPGQFVLVVELEIDPAQLEPFKAAIKENGETAVRVEPGCRSFSAVFEKDNPTRVRLFEIYDNADAFKAHLETPALQEVCRDHEGHGQVAQANRQRSHHAQREGEVTAEVPRRSVSVDCCRAA